MNELKTTLNGDINSICEHINSHGHRFNNVEDDFNRLRHSADLRLTGLPYNENENLLEVFEKIAATLNYDTTASVNIPLIERIPIRIKLINIMIPSHTIIFHFSTQAHKQIFYTRYLEKLPAKLYIFAVPNGI